MAEPTARMNLAREVLNPTQETWPLIGGVFALEGPDALDTLIEAFNAEVELDGEARSQLNWPSASTRAALALLREEPVAAHVGRVMYWNVYLYLTAEKLGQIVAAFREENG